MSMEKSYHRPVILLIISFAILRWIIAWTLELGNDESYYWLYSRYPQWSYFDHPPLAGIWIRIFTLGGWLDQYEGMVRAGSVISCAFSTWFIYKAVSIIHSGRAGWYAACLFNASYYSSIIAGILVMPDSPQLFFWTLCLWQMARLIQNDRLWSAWLLIGISTGLAVMSKVHGVFLWSGLGLFILFQKPGWLRKKALYVSLAISLLIASPILLWNMRYDFITWRFHSARVDVTVVDKQQDGFWMELLQQIVVNNPVNFLLIIIALAALLRHRQLHPALSLYNFIALPLAMVVLLISIFRDVWYHWSSPAYITLLPLAAVYLADKIPVVQKLKLPPLFPAWTRWSSMALVLVLIAWPMVVKFYPGTYGRKEAAVAGQNDVTLDKFGWKQAGNSFKEIYSDKHAAAVPLISPTWWGAHIEYYFGEKQFPTIALGPINDIHFYAWLNAVRIPEVSMDTAYCIVPSIDRHDNFRSIASYYRHMSLDTIFTVKRSGKIASNFYVYRLTGWKTNEEDDVAIINY